MRLLKSWFAYALLPLVGLATAPILARVLGPDGRGQLAGILQPLSVADTILLVGVPTAVTFFVSRGSEYQNVRRHALSLMIVAAIIVAVGLFWYSESVSQAIHITRPVILIIWASTFIGGLIAQRRAAFQGMAAFHLLDRERATSAVVRLFGVLFLAAIGVTVAPAYAGVMIGSGLLASGILFLRGVEPLVLEGRRFRRRVPTFADFSRYALLAGIGQIASGINNRLDQAILPVIVSASELGYYSVAVTVAEVPLILVAVVSRNLLSEVSSAVGTERVVRTVIAGLAAVAGAAGVIAGLCVWAIPLVFGDDFEPAVACTQILLLGTFVGAIGAFCSAVLAGRGTPGRSAIGPILSAISVLAFFGVLWGSIDIVVACWIAVGAQTVGACVGVIMLFWGGRVRSAIASRVSRSLINGK